MPYDEPATPQTDGGDVGWKGLTMPWSTKKLYGPGAPVGTVPSDFQQATGTERYELLHRMAGIDPFHTEGLYVPFLGTLKNPVFVYATGATRAIGCTGFPVRSHRIRWLRVRMGPIATRCGICGCAYALDYVGPLRSSQGKLMSYKPGSQPEDCNFVEDEDLHRRDNYAREVRDDYAPEREDWPMHSRQIEQRWDGWWRGETPDNWDLVHVADENLRTQLIEAREDEQANRAVAWWDYAKGHPKAAEATPEKPKEFWGSHVMPPHSHDLFDDNLEIDGTPVGEIPYAERVAMLDRTNLLTVNPFNPLKNYDGPKVKA